MAIAYSLMTVEDIDAVLHIEQVSFTTPWSRGAFLSELTSNPLALYFVGRLDERVVSYGGCWLIHGEAHITNVAVDPGFRGMGFGEGLCLWLMREASLRGMTRATLEVRVSNVAARKLYQKLGFLPVGVRPKYYTDTQEDALIMWKDKLDALAEDR
ncbi:MAG: Ribosomal-protein-alanine acetyltransferase [Firmicutes bacterium]|nr:Ribosomal-protein-alanine acetyltransferase [candidate division NPL-UPA2 bacterium]MBT9154139.1 Ribosomal-protein-alanine acetyltransferase [candidate division NPL-UPA2 bacterium]MBT9156015.1 Ribosomal-protein-alanine acetyltransferase [candidate division NPL-UPA2 bacterium]